MDYTEINFIERLRSSPQSHIFIFAADLHSMPVINRNTYHDLHTKSNKLMNICSEMINSI